MEKLWGSLVFNSVPAGCSPLKHHLGAFGWVLPLTQTPQQCLKPALATHHGPVFKLSHSSLGILKCFALLSLWNLLGRAVKPRAARAAFKYLHPRKKIVLKTSPKVHFYFEVANARGFCNHSCPKVILLLQGTSAPWGLLCSPSFPVFLLANETVHGNISGQWDRFVWTHKL